MPASTRHKVASNITTPADATAGVLLWHGMAVRTRDGAELGEIVGVFETGPCKGRLRVHGNAEQFPRRYMTGTAVFAIPPSAVARHSGRTVVLTETATSARHRWFMHVIQI